MSLENNNIGLRIRKTRESQKLTRERLAELSSISTQFLADIETGKKGMTVVTLKKLCDSLNVSADFIIYGKQDVDLKGVAQAMQKLDTEQQLKLLEIFKEIIEL